ncbi:hypothetical protein FQN55_006572 [Onygenales sp. PD_40]|nr:hypothetical protein FQN55_006572 [Onygenales sp. PD_40]KAK2777344.1 hypothetical protein FQN52_003176 [Onygenales sp. PD_12]KAK2803928.1 hypothetical protein FQN51_002814 [Onygenales sp. PD_10]
MEGMYTGIQKKQLFDSLESFKSFVRSASIRQRWELSVIRSNKKSVTLGCRSSSDCAFRAVCRTNKNYTYVTSANDVHTCRNSSENAISRSEHSRVQFLMKEIPKFFDLNSKISAQQVVEAIKRYYGSDIAPRQAHRALLQLEMLKRKRQRNTNSSPLHPATEMSSEEIGDSHHPDEWLHNQNILPLPIGSDDDLQATGGSHGHQITIQQPGPPVPAPASPPYNHVPISHVVQGSDNRTRLALPPHDRHHDQDNSGPRVVTNLKVEFACGSCGAINQGFFPSHGQVMQAAPANCSSTATNNP